MLSKFFDLKSARFRLSIIGLPMIETTISDTLKVANNRYVNLFSALLGLTIGVFTSLMLKFNGHSWILPLIFFPIAPIIINFLSNYIAALYVRLYIFLFNKNNVIIYPIVNTIYTMFITSIMVWAIFLFFQKIVEPGTDVNFIILLFVPIFYVAVTETVHHIIYRYIIHDIEQDEQPMTAFFKPQEAPTHIAVDANEASPIGSPQAVTIGMQTIDATDIVMLESQGNYLKVVTLSGEFTERCQMSTAVEALDESFGLQIHRSFWVSFSAIYGLTRVDGNLCVQLTNGDVVKIARPRQRRVRDVLTSRGVMLEEYRSPPSIT